MKGNQGRALFAVLIARRRAIAYVRQDRFRGGLDELFVAGRALEPPEIVELMKHNELPQSEIAAARK